MPRPPKMDADTRVLFDIYCRLRPSLTGKEATGFDSWCRINGFIGPHRKRAIERHEGESLDALRERWARRKAS